MKRKPNATLSDTGFTRSRPARVGSKVRDTLRVVGKGSIPGLAVGVAVFLLIGGGIIFFVERNSEGGMFLTLADALWWGIVTITTVGYGDKFPITPIGRVLASAIMLAGVAVTSTLSGTIASVFIDRKIQEGRGLQELTLHGHTLICGWNRQAEGVLETLSNLKAGTRDTMRVVLVNELDPEVFQDVKARFPSLDLRFVRGDMSGETVLQRAAVGTAKSAVLLPDSSGAHNLAGADERTILTALTIKALNPGITISAEVVNAENERHLRRAQVDDILVNGEFSGFLLAQSIRSVGIPDIARELLASTGQNAIRHFPIPSSFVGHSFRELSSFCMDTGKGIVIAIRAEEKNISLDDILSDDSSSIDAFIKRKFREADIDLVDDGRPQVRVMVGPAPDYIIRETDSAFVIGSGS